MPGYQSVINHITGADGLLKKHVHLYKEGMEQDEPAAAGSEQTKDESANGEFENALIEVAELYEEAKAIEAGKSAAKKEAAGESKQAQRMQDEAVNGEMSEEEYKKTQRARKRRSPSKSGVKRMTVADYCKEHDSADEETILMEGKPPKGYLLIVPTGADDGEFDEVRDLFAAVLACCMYYPSAPHHVMGLPCAVYSHISKRSRTQVRPRLQLASGRSWAT